MADLRADGRSVLGQPLYVDSETAKSMEVIVNTNGGAVTGTIGGKSTKSFVALVPQGIQQSNALWYKTATIEDGRIALSGVAPGEYKIYAWEYSGGILPEFGNPAFLSKYSQRGVTVRVREGTTSTVGVVPLIPVSDQLD